MEHLANVRLVTIVVLRLGCTHDYSSAAIVVPQSDFHQAYWSLDIPVSLVDWRLR